MTPGHLRPQAECTAGRATTAGVQGNVGVLAIGAVVFAEVEVAIVDLGDKRQAVQLLARQRGTVEVVRDLAVLAVADAQDFAPVPPFGYLFYRVVKLFACDEVDRLGRLEGLVRGRGRVAAHEGNHTVRVFRLNHLGGAHVQLERGGAGMQDNEVVRFGDRHGLALVQLFRWGIQHPAVFDHPGRVAQPGRVPEGLHLAGGLITRACAAIKIIVRGGVQEQRPHFLLLPELLWTRLPAQPLDRQRQEVTQERHYTHRYG